MCSLAGKINNKIYAKRVWDKNVTEFWKRAGYKQSENEMLQFYVTSHQIPVNPIQKCRTNKIISTLTSLRQAYEIVKPYWCIRDWISNHFTSWDLITFVILWNSLQFLIPLFNSSLLKKWRSLVQQDTCVLSYNKVEVHLEQDVFVNMF